MDLVALVAQETVVLERVLEAMQRITLVLVVVAVVMMLLVALVALES